MYQQHTLNNGIRIVHRQISNGVAHCGLIINAGSREEQDHENGIAHFIEHMIFKGTRKRKAYHILTRMENVGGDLNAYTTKEETCVHCSFLPVYYDRALELMNDIAFNSIFPEKEIPKEKDVVIDEINSYKDNPSEEIYDEFENLLFDGHTLGRNILGTIESLQSITKEKILGFIGENYIPGEIVISSIGNIPFEKLVRLIEKYYAAVGNNKQVKPRTKFTNYKTQGRVVEKPTFLTHACIGNLSYAASDPRRMVMVLLNNILGGPGMNSRLNLAIREKYGLTYNIYSNYQPYSDTGVFTVYLGTTGPEFDKSMQLVHKEFDLLCTRKMGTLQFIRAKQQLKGQLAIAFESHLSEMLSKGKSLLQLNRVFTLHEIFERIDMVTTEQLIETANEVFDKNRLSTLVFLSNSNETDAE